MRTYWAKIAWVETNEDGKTIRRADYDDCKIEVFASQIGGEGDFLAEARYWGKHFGPHRITGSRWFKSAEEALDEGCESAVNRVDCRDD